MRAPLRRQTLDLDEEYRSRPPAALPAGTGEGRDSGSDPLAYGPVRTGTGVVT
jgi:hypothetical protein